ncbi:MAG: hypothetical protein HWN67_20695 [Candidatus Helarchaeota archaeon]|nr:hypothetical protein [Candidatus Helarchaeota archaeon]
MITKKEAVDEIGKTVLFFLRERDKGKEDIDIYDFLDNKLEKSIIENFDGTISKDEYEELIFKIFEVKEIKIGNFYFKDIDSFLEDLVLKHNVRNKSKIIEKIKDEFSVSPEQINKIKKYILMKYRDIASDYLRKIFSRKISEGIVDNEKLIKIGKKEGFKINSEHIENIVIEQKRRFLSKEEPGLKTKDYKKRKYTDKGVGEKERLRQRRIKSYIERLNVMKERFIEKYCKAPKFDLIENKIVEGKRNFLHKSTFGGREIYVRSISNEGEIENIIIEFKRMIHGEKKYAKIDIIEIRNILNSPNGLNTFTRKLKSLNSILGFSNFQELVWFFGNFMTEVNYIPKKTARFLKENFRDYVEELDKSLFEYTIHKSFKFA